MTGVPVTCAGSFAMELGASKLTNALRIGPHIRCRPGLAPMKAQTITPLAVYSTCRREARGMGGPGTHRLARAVHVVEGKVLAEARDVRAPAHPSTFQLSLERPPFSGSAVMGPSQQGSSRT